MLINFDAVSAGWSWHGKWHWQIYHVPEQIQSSAIAKKITKNESPSENMGFT